jgi:hypothetical protein
VQEAAAKRNEVPSAWHTASHTHVTAIGCAPTQMRRRAAAWRLQCVVHCTVSALHSLHRHGVCFMVSAACCLLHAAATRLSAHRTIRSEEGVRCRQATKDKKEPTEKPLTG